MAKKFLLEKWDTNKPILDAFVASAEANKGVLINSSFESIVVLYDMDKTDHERIVCLMEDSATHDFIPVPIGWDVSPK